MMTGPLCNAARALVEISRSDLADAAGVEESVIAAFEQQTQTPEPATIAALRNALEKLGAVFIPEEGSLGAGVRLKFSRTVTERLADLENEGGPAASDDVP